MYAMTVCATSSTSSHEMHHTSMFDTQGWWPAIKPGSCAISGVGFEKRAAYGCGAGAPATAAITIPPSAVLRSIKLVCWCL